VRQPPDSDVLLVAETVAGPVSGNVVVTGRIQDGVYIRPSDRQAVSLPYRFGTAPLRAFQQRTIAADLAETVEAGQVAVFTSDGLAGTCVLSGVAGVDKTPLVLEYAETCGYSGSWHCSVAGIQVGSFKLSRASNFGGTHGRSR
jgi:hypothetical protein